MDLPCSRRGWRTVCLTVRALPPLKCENSGIRASDAGVIQMLLTFKCTRYLIEAMATRLRRAEQVERNREMVLEGGAPGLH